MPVSQFISATSFVMSTSSYSKNFALFIATAVVQSV